MGKNRRVNQEDTMNTWDQTVNNYNSNIGNRSNQNPQKKRNKRKKNKHIFGKVLAIIQGLLSLLLLGSLLILNILPVSYLIIVAVVLLILWLFVFLSQFTRKTHIPGKVISFLICIVLALASYYLLITNNLLGSITGLGYKIDNVVVVVLDEDPAQSLEDAADYTFAIHSSLSRDSVDAAIEEINETLGKEITVVTYDGFGSMVEALYSGEVGALIYNTAWETTMEEMHEGYTEAIRILESKEIKTKTTSVSSSNKKVTKEPFIVYITGNDSYGSIATTGRSDVNMLVCVNPKTRQILMVSTPRDSYLVFADNVTNGTKDKLTHAGNFGIDVQIGTMEELYDIDIDFYARVNFTSLVNIVDALGGVDVYSEYSFTAMDGRSFSEGYNTLDGESALMFSRERYAFTNGDFQRGKNQQAVLTAIIKKAISPAILTSYASLIGSLEGNVDTSMAQNDITSLVKMQLNDGGSWNIVSSSATGKGGSEYCYSSNGNASVVILDDESIKDIKTQIQSLLNGETLVQGTTVESE